jgi:ribosomal protein L37AE/L43A
MTLQAFAPTSSYRRQHPAMPECPRCGDTVLAPEIAEHVSPRQVRHIWSCDSCGAGFATSVDLSAVIGRA